MKRVGMQRAGMQMNRAGTRFRLLAKFDDAMVPETVVVSSPAGSLGPGPRDARMHAIDPVEKTAPYDPPRYGPPYRGAVRPPARPDAQGHFDHILPGAPGFLAAHLFGTVRHTLDIWERYLGHPVRWWHADDHPSLELIPMVQWANAQCGLGFLETGLWPLAPDAMEPFALNGDVVAHETGHAIVFSVLGAPSPERLDGMYLGFHESFSDLVALIGALHMASVRRVLLRETGGDLYVLNLVIRIGELSPHAQIRIAANGRTMADVAGLSLAADGSWIDPAGLGRDAHDMAQPLTGAVFDVLADIYQSELIGRGLTMPGAHRDRWTHDQAARYAERNPGATRAAQRRFAGAFDTALMVARDAVGRALAHVLATVEADGLRYDIVAARFLESLARQGLGPRMPALMRLFQRRGIDPVLRMRLAPAPGRMPGLVAQAAPRVARGCRCHAHTHDANRANALLQHRHRTISPHAQNAVRKIA